MLLPKAVVAAVVVQPRLQAAVVVVVEQQPLQQADQLQPLRQTRLLPRLLAHLGDPAGEPLRVIQLEMVVQA
jgi:hypothetical protein